MKGIRHGDEIVERAQICSECADAVFQTCVSQGLLLDNLSLDLDLSRDNVKMVLDDNMPLFYSKEYQENESVILDTIMQSRYVNLYYLLRVSSCLNHIIDVMCISDHSLVNTAICHILGPSFRRILCCNC
jgi:hypothetical protein